MDKTFFVKQTIEQAANHQQYYNTLDKNQKAEVFFTLMQAAYRFVGKPYPKMEKVFIGSRKLEANE